MKLWCKSRFCCVVLFAYCSLADPSSLLSQVSEWPPVSPQELALKDNPGHAGDPAVLLYRDVYTDDEKRFTTNYHRIKIFKDEGKKYADIEIPYVEKETEIIEIRARTIRPDGSPLEFQGQILDNVVRKAKGLEVHTKVLAIPAVELGSIIEYWYKVKWKQGFPDYLKEPERYIMTQSFAYPTETWVLQDNLFTRHARFVLHPLPKANLQWTAVRLPQNASIQRPLGGNTVQLELDNIPALEDEDFLPPEDMLNSRVHLYYQVGYGLSPARFWQEVMAIEAESVDKFVGKPKNMERTVSQLISSADSPEVKLHKIYNRVQQLRYASYERGSTERLKENKNVEDVLGRGYAFSNEINYLFVAMARAAGFDASMVSLTDRASHVFDASVMDASQLNAKVVRVHLPDKDIYLDPATPYCPYGLLPWYESGVEGLVEDRSFAAVNTTRQSADQAVISRKANLRLATDGTLQGTLQVSYTGQEALMRRLIAHYEDEAGKRKGIEDEIKTWLREGSTLTIDKVTDWEGSEAPLLIDCRIAVPAAGLYTGHRLLLKPAIFQAKKKSPFQQAKRSYPIYFLYPRREIDAITVTLPPGFKIESLPTSRSASPEKPLRFETSFIGQVSSVEFQRKFTLDGFIFPVSYFPTIKSTYDQMAASDAETIVLQSTEAASKQ